MTLGPTNAAEYRARRQALLEAISPGVVLLPAAPVALRNNDVDHAYRQHSDLFYLTGFDEPESCLVLSTVRAPHYQLFVRPRDPSREVWDGPRSGTEGAQRDFGAEEAREIDELDGALADILLGHERVFTELGADPQWDERLFRAARLARRKAKRGGVVPTQFVELGSVLHEHRRLKSELEVAAMRRAGQLSAEAHVAAMKAVRPGMNEREIEAVVFEHCRRNGAQRMAYESIVGSGPNATVLHYVRNDRAIGEGELVLVDAGCECDYYASDITRTFPASGTFSVPQARLYDVVLDAQKACIERCRPGATLSEIQRIAVQRLTEGLVRHGLVEGPVEAAIDEGRYKKFYMHNVSHYLGMDVHDVGPYYRGDVEVPLEPGVVITIEPGLYVSVSDDTVPEEYRGIGIRIEDDLLIVADGHEVLTAGAPKDRSEVERLATSTA